MPELKCTVQTCLHNQNYYCDLDSIKVGGSSAKHAQDTCCDSFEERKGLFLGKCQKSCHSCTSFLLPFLRLV